MRAAGAVVALTAAACSSSSATGNQNTQPSAGSIPKVSSAATPSGWSPVPFGNVQISVPGDWTVAANGEFTCAADGGSVFLGRASTSFGKLSCPARTTVSVVPLSRKVQLPATVALTVHGISVEAEIGNRSTDAVFYVPDLGVVLSGQGPDSLKVLRTLTHSPLAVVTAGAAQTPTPQTWRTISFGGVTMKAPRSWPLGKTNSVGYCSLNVNPDEVMLSTAQKHYNLFCPAPSPRASDLAAVQGLIAFSGPHSGDAVTDPKTSRTLTVNGLELRISQASETGGTLVATISVPGQAHKLVLWLGLAGDGMLARAIVDSIHAS